MEYGNHIVGIAKLHEESDKCLDYDVVVAAHAPIPADKIARNIKNMIGTSNKWEDTPSIKHRKYYVEEVDCHTLPIKAEIKFSRLYWYKSDSPYMQISSYFCIVIEKQLKT